MVCIPCIPDGVVLSYIRLALPPFMMEFHLHLPTAIPRTLPWFPMGFSGKMLVFSTIFQIFFRKRGTKCQAQPCGRLGFSGQTHAQALCSSWSVKVNTSNQLGNRFFPTKLRKSLEKSEKMLGNGRYDPFFGGRKLLLIFQGELLKMVKKYDGMVFIAFFSP